MSFSWLPARLRTPLRSVRRRLGAAPPVWRDNAPPARQNQDTAPPARPRALFEELEPRLLYSADSPAAWLPSAVLPAAVVEVAQPAAVQAVPPSAAVQAVPVMQASRELVFIDAGVVHTQALVDSLQAQRPAGVELQIITLQAGQDGLQQMGAVLARESGLAAVHIVAHGEQAALQLGSTRLDATTLAARSAELQAWRSALSDEADLLLYGCDVAAGEAGAAFIQALAGITGADVAASTNTTGSVAAGGDSVLEAQVGTVTTHAASLQALQGVLGLQPTSGEVLVNTNATSDQTTSVFGGGNVAMDSAGNSVVVWNDLRTHSGDVYFQRYDAAGVAQGVNVLVNASTTDLQSDANVAMNDSGNFVVVWSSAAQDGSGLGIYAQRFDASGAAVGGEVLVNTTTASDQLHPTVAVASSGAFVVAWTDASSGNNNIRAQRFDAGGAAQGGEFVVNSSTGSSQQFPTAAMTTGGDFVVLWESDHSGNFNVYGQRYDGAGVAQGAEFQVNSFSANVQWNVAVAVDGSGNFVAVWDSSSQDPDSSAGIYGQRFNASGVAQGAEFRVNSTTVNAQTIPAVAMDSGGSFVVSWTSLSQDGDGSGVYAQAFDAAGNTRGGELRVNTTTAAVQSVPAVALAGEKALVVWAGNGVGDTQGVFARPLELTTFNRLVVQNSSDVADGDMSSATALINNPGADGSISLREAITAANNTANGSSPDRIEFDISGAGPHTITPAAALPSITDAVVLDATTSSDFTANGNQPVVVIDGNDLAANGLVLAAGSGGSTVRGLVLRDFAGAGLQLLSGSDGNTVVGNYIGRLNTSGGDAGAAESNTGVGLFIQSANNRVGGASVADRNLLAGNSTGVHIDGLAATGNRVSGNRIGTDAAGTTDLGNTINGVSIYGGAANNTIGTNLDGNDDATEGNLISGNDDTGVQIMGAGSGNTVRGNLVGVDATATAALGNGAQGIQIFGATTGTVVGGTSALAANVVGGNAFRGIEIGDVGSTGNVVLGNFVGTNSGGVLSLPNGSGIGVVTGAAANTIGGVAAGSGNVVAYNSFRGIEVTGSGTGNSLLRNLVQGNGALEIDVGAVGLTTNDAGDVDSGANDLQNFPVLATANSTGGDTTVTGSFNSNASTSYRIEFFSAPAADGSGHGGGAVFLGSTTVSTDAGGNANIGLVLVGVSVSAGHVVSATATVDLGGGNYGSTSEFAANVTATAVPAGISVGAISGNSTEAGGTATFTVVLDTAPLADVTVPVSSSNTLEGTVSTALLTFTTTNWATPQTVTVTGQNDTLDDGDHAYSLVLGAASSADAAYNGINPADVAATNTDNDNRNTVLVTTTSDSADGDTSSLYALLANPGADSLVSLREALTAANNSANGAGGVDRIHFSIAGAGPHVITPLVALPDITQAVLIDGSTEPDFASNGNRPVVVLDGNNLAAAGLVLAGGSSGSTLRGLVVRDFASDGIDILAASSGNTVVGNYIGRLFSDGSDAGAGEGNSNAGILVASAGNRIGGLVAAEQNLIFGNGDGIVLTGAGATGNALLGNAIWGHSNLGLDLGNNGITANDTGDADTGPNNRQNFPVLSQMRTDGSGQLSFQVALDSTANSYFRIELFASASSNPLGNGEGSRYLGYVNLATDGAGLADQPGSLAVVVAPGEVISATATRSDVGYASYSDTSEFALNTTATLAPVLVTTGGSLAVTENDAAAPLDAALTVSDGDSANLVSAVIMFGAGFASGQDTLQFTDQLGITGSWNAGAGTLTLTGSAPVADYQTALRSVHYVNTSDAPSTAARTVHLVVHDGVAPGATVTRGISVTAVNDAPTVTTTGGTLGVAENSGGTSVDPGLLLADVDSGTLTAASVSITAAYVTGQDLLLFTDQLGITGSWNAGTGVLTLSGTATVANYQTALRSVAYLNNSEAPDVTLRTVAFQVNDGTLGSAAATRDLQVTAVNDAPVLDNSAAMLLTTIARTAATNPGNTVAQMIGSVSGNRITDVDSAALEGAAITASNSAGLGAWEYSLDGGGTWLPVGAVAQTSALLLRDTDRVRLAPSGAGNGQAMLTFHAWDQSSGAAGTWVDASSTGGSQAFSSAVETATIDVVENTGGPVAVDDSAQTQVGVAVPVAVVTNDLDPQGNPLVVLDISNPANGTLALAGNTVTYTPNGGFSGVDAFNYLISDGNEGLTHYWKLDGDATDSVGGSNGVLVNGPTTVAGPYGNALQFDGVDDHVTLPDQVYTNEFSLSFRFRVDTNAGNEIQYFYSHGLLPTSGQTNMVHVALVEASNAVVVQRNHIITTVFDSNDATDGSGQLLVNVAGLIGDGQWHQYTATVTPGVGTRVYIDGVLGGSVNRGGDAINPTAGTVLGGRTDLEPTRYLNAGSRMDSLALFNRALSAGEVADFWSGGSSQGTVTVDVNALPVVATSGGSASYSENAVATVVDAGLTVSDANSASLAGAVLSISSNYLAGQDSLQFSNQLGISGSWNVGTGVLTLTGTASVADYQTALRSVAYLNSSDAPSTLTRVVSVVVNDGLADSASAQRNVDVLAVNDAPGASNLNAAESYTEDTALDLTDIVISDVDSATGSATLTLSDAAAGGLGTATSGAVTSTYNAGTGVWSASGALADVNTLLASLSFTPALNFNGIFSISTSVSDGVAAPVTGSKAFTGVPVNDAPTASNLSTAQTYTEDTALNLVTVVVTDVDSATVTATLTLSDAAAGALNTGTSGAVTSTYGAGTGVWTASGALADVNTLLAALVFTPATNYTSAFVINTSVSDSVAAPVTGGQNLSVTPVNDAPTASNLNAAETYTEDLPLNLTDIVVADVDSANVTATLTLANPAAGALSTATSGAVTASFNAGTGVWTASGALADVNTLLANVVFTPAADFNGGFSINTSVDDGEAAAITGSKLFTGTPVNDTPTASNLSAAAAYTEDTPLNLPAIAVADIDSAGGSATLVLSNPGAGTLNAGTAGAVSASYNPASGVWTASGAWADVNTLLAALVFTPTADFNAGFSIATSVSDGVAAPITGTQMVTGTPVNDAPTASGLNAAETYTEDQPLNLVGVVVGDIDSAAITATYTLSNATVGVLSTGTVGAVTSSFNPATGVWTASGALADVNSLLATLVFMPAADFNGSFSITTHVDDGVAASITGSKLFSGTAVNDAPTASNLSAAESYTEDTPLNITAIVAADIDSASLTVTLTLLDSAVGAFSVGTAGAVTSTFNASTGVWLASGATADVNALLAALTFTPALNHNGGFSVASTVDDGVAPPISGVKTFSGLAVNDAPTASGLDSAETYTEDTPMLLQAIVVSDVDNTTGSATLVLSDAAAGSLSTGSAGAVVSSFNAATGVWTASGALVDVNTLLAAVSFVPAPDFNGSFSIDTQVSDGLAPPVLGRKDFTNTAVNDAPTASNLNRAETYTEDTPLNLAATVVSDVDSATSAVNISATLVLSNTAAGSLNAATAGGVSATFDAGTGVWFASGALADVNTLLAGLRFTPVLNFNGSFNLGMQVSDGIAAPLVGSRLFTGVAVNDAPVQGVTVGLQVLEGSETPLTAAQLNATDVDHGAAGLIYTVVSAPAHGWLVRGGAVLAPGTAFTQADVDAGAVAYRHDASETTADSFELDLADAGGAAAVVVAAGQGNNPSGGNGGDGHGNDGSGLAAATTTPVPISITPVNDETPRLTSPLPDAPGATGAVVAVPENTRTVTTVTASDADLPAQTVSFEIAGGADAALFSINSATGELQFISAPDFEQPLDADGNNRYQIDLRLHDGQLFSTHSVTVAVTPGNDNAPQLISNGAQASAGLQVQEGEQAVLTVVAVDADLPAPVLRYSLAGGADAALFVLDANSGALRFVVAPIASDPRDSNRDNLYEVVVQASDGSQTARQVLQVLVRATVVPEVPANAKPVDSGAAPLPYTGEAETPAGGAVDVKPAPVEALLPTPAEEQALSFWQGDNPRAVRSFKLLDTAATRSAGEMPAEAGATLLQPSAELAAQGTVFQTAAPGADSDTPSLEAALGLPTADAGLLQVRPGGLSLAALAAQAAARSSTSVPSGLAPVLPGGDAGAGDDAESSVISAIATPVVAGGVAFSATLLVWATRAGGLVAAMMASVPAWRSLDPLPILERKQFSNHEGDNGDGAGALPGVSSTLFPASSFPPAPAQPAAATPPASAAVRELLQPLEMT